MKTIKKYIIPHEGNEHQPHILRLPAVVGVLEFILLAQVLVYVAGVALLPQSSYFAEILSHVIVDETNKSRAAVHLPSLTLSPVLTQSAQLKADDMAAKGYFAHISPEGTTPWTWFKQAGYSYEYAGENLAVNFFDSREVADAWMKSETHRANVLHEKFTEIGIGTASGQFQGSYAVFVVEHFGRPRNAVAVAPSLPTPSPVASPQPRPLPPAPTPVQQPTVVIVRGTEAPAVQAPQKSYATLPQRILVSPRQGLNFVYITLLAIVALAVALKIWTHSQAPHPPLLVNGAILLIIITSALIFNELISRSQTIIS